MRHPESKDTRPARDPHQDARPEDASKALFRDAMQEARRLKREHRGYYDAGPKAFRAVIAKAHSRVFGMKPGPPADPLISRAAREVALGTRVEVVFKRELPHRRPGDDDVYSMAMENFRGKVNTYIRKHPRLKRLRDRRKRSTTEPVRSNSVPD